MKKLISLLMAVMLCLSVAMADTVTCGGYEIAVPENWGVAAWQEEGDTAFLQLQEISTEPVQTIHLYSADLKSWDTVANDQQAMLNYLMLTVRVSAIADKAVGEEAFGTGYVMLRDGGMAWRGTYETETGDTYGRVVMVHEGKTTFAYIADKDGDQQQYLNMMNEMIRPVRVAQEVEAGGLRLALPAGWQRHEGKDEVFFSLSEESGNLAMFYTLDVDAKDIKNAVEAGQLSELLIQAARTVFTSYEFSDVQAETVDLGGIPGIIAGLNVKMNGATMGMGVLSALVEDRLVCGMVLTASGKAQDGLEWMKVMLHPMMEAEPLMISEKIVLAHPQGFVRENTNVAEDGTLTTELIDRPLSFAAYMVSPVSDEELTQDVWSYLAGKLGSNEAKSKKNYVNGAKGVLLSGQTKNQGVEYAYTKAAVLHENRLIQVNAYLIDRDAQAAQALVESLLFAEAANDTLQLGKLTVHVPAGLTMQEIAQEGVQLAMQASDHEKAVYASMLDVSENMKDAINGMGEQMGLEIYLSIWVTEARGAEGVTIEYTPDHQGMAMVRTSFEQDGTAAGYAYLLDGDTLYAVAVIGGSTEADGMKLLNAVLGYAQ